MYYMIAHRCRHGNWYTYIDTNGET